MPASRALPLTLLAVHAAMLAALCFAAKLTTDEANYVVAGTHLRQHLDWGPYNTVLHGPLAFFANQLGALVADPGAFPAYLPWGRLGMIPFSVLAAAGTWRVATRCFGPGAGVAALFLWCCNPIVLANGCLMTADMALACGAIWTIERTLAWVRAPSWPRALAVGAVLGATLATKYFAVFLVPTLAAALGMWVAGARTGTLTRRATVALVATVAVAAGAWVTLRTCYLWTPRYEVAAGDPTAAPEDAHAPLQSEQFRTLAASRAGRAVLELLPAPFVRGIDYQKRVAESLPSSFGDRIGPGFWGYYVTALSVKLPLAFLVLLVLGVLRRLPPAQPWAAPVLAAAVLVPLVLLSGFTTLQIGVRYALSVLPALAVLAGRGLVGLGTGWATRALGAGLALVLVAGTATTWPAYLTDFNLLAPRPYLLFRDSTLDWRAGGSADADLAALRARHPDAILANARTGPALGWVIAHGDQLGPQDPRDPTRVHHWLRRFWPTDRSGAWYAFQVDASEFVEVARAEASPRALAEFAAALLGARDLDGAAAAVAALDDPLAATVRAGIATVRGGDAAAIARVWLDLGRPDLLAALGDAAPLALRAQGRFLAHDLDGVIRLLAPAEAAGQLAAAEQYLLASALRDAGRGPEALALLERMVPDAGARAVHEQITTRLRQELEASGVMPGRR